MPYMICPKCQHRDHATGVDMMPCTKNIQPYTCPGIMVPEGDNRALRSPPPERFGPGEASRPRPTHAEREARAATAEAATEAGETRTPPPAKTEHVNITIGRIEVRSEDPDRFVRSVKLATELPAMGPRQVVEAAAAATGADLDMIATHLGLVRLVLETDEYLRERIGELCGKPLAVDQRPVVSEGVPGGPVITEEDMARDMYGNEPDPVAYFRERAANGKHAARRVSDAVLAATATGAALDEIGARYNLLRAEGNADDWYRQHLLDAIEQSRLTAAAEYAREHLAAIERDRAMIAWPPRTAVDALRLYLATCQVYPRRLDARVRQVARDILIGNITSDVGEALERARPVAGRDLDALEEVRHMFTDGRASTSNGLMLDRDGCRSDAKGVSLLGGTVHQMAARAADRARVAEVARGAGKGEARPHGHVMLSALDAVGARPHPEPDHLTDLEREIAREAGALAGDVHRLSPMGDNARWYIEVAGTYGAMVRHLLVRVSGKQIAAFLHSGADEDVTKLAALAVANAVELRAPTCEPTPEPKSDQAEPRPRDARFNDMLIGHGLALESVGEILDTIRRVAALCDGPTPDGAPPPSAKVVIAILDEIAHRIGEEATLTWPGAPGDDPEDEG